jgi:hypothetical protein
MEAQIMFVDPGDVDPAVVVLTERDFAVEIQLDLIDECGPTVFVQAQVASELDASGFFDWVESIVEPLGGDVLQAGDCDPPPQFA